MNGVLQVGAGFAFVTDNTQSPAQNLLLGMFKAGQAPLKIKQEFANGERQFDMYAANISQELTGTLEFQALDTKLLQAVHMAQIGVAGLSDIAMLEATLTKSTSVTVTGAVDVLMVRDATTGAIYSKVASTPVAGTSYAFTTPTITLASGDTGSILVTYTKKASSESKLLTLSNAIPQQSVYFGVRGVGAFDGKQCHFNFPRACCTDLPSLFDSGDKFAQRKLGWKALAHPDTGLIGTISLTESAS